MAAEESATAGIVTAAVCTRNRGDSVVATISSLLESVCADFEVVIIDQSDDDSSETALGALLNDNRVRYVRSTTRGLGSARNEAIRIASGEICCFTDDDCTVPPDWLGAMADVFRKDERIAVVFCNVIAGPHDYSKGFVPCYRCEKNRIFARIQDKSVARGIGAGMAVRRSAMVEMGGFDEMLGPGGRFPSCDDGDIASRALLLGYCVYETSETAVTHFGFRTWEQGRELGRRDWIGIGAAFVKPLKCHRWVFLPVVLHEVFTWAIGQPLKPLLRLRRPQGLSRTIHFLRGAWLGWQTTVNPATLKYCVGSLHDANGKHHE